MKFHHHRSLFRRLFLGFLTVMLSIWLVNLVWDIHETKTSKKKAQTQQLRATALRILVIVQTVADRPDQLAAVVQRMEKLHYPFYDENNWYVPRLQTQVWKGHDLVYVSSEPGLPPTIASAPPSEQPMDSSWASAIETDPATGYTVRMATEIVGAWFWRTSSVGYYFLPVLYSFPFLLLPAWFIIGIGLRPLKSIVSEIEERSESDLCALAPSPYKELSPLVSSVNRLMDRLSERLMREKEFLIDAAHELKTPLAIIQLHADSLAKNSDPQRIKDSTGGLAQGVARATHTVHQLLALERSSGDRDRFELQATDLVDFVRHRIVLAAPLALPRGIDIEFQSPETCTLPLHRETAAALIDNLIINAVKYSPDNAHVLVSVTSDERGVRFSVADQGPGIPVELRKKVFERFFRLGGQEKTGSGLGLAIAERAATRNNASILLAEGANGIGLMVVVEFRSDREKLSA
jgi:signal transduction histidine kinase